VGFLCVIAQLSEQHEAMLFLGSVTIAVMGTLPSRMAKENPKWLQVSLNLSAVTLSGAQIKATVLYSMAVYVPMLLVAVLNWELKPMILCLSLAIFSVHCSVGSAFLYRRWPTIGTVLYSPFAFVSWAILQWVKLC
jgi:hypothetical protein